MVVEAPTSSDVENADDSWHVAFYVHSLFGGGAERATLRLIEAFCERGWRVDLLVDRLSGAHCSKIPDGVRVFELERGSKVVAAVRMILGLPSVARVVLPDLVGTGKTAIKYQYLGSLIRYFRTEEPQLVVAVMNRANLLALVAKKLCRSDIPVVISERNTLSKNVYLEPAHEKKASRDGGSTIVQLVQRLYPLASGVVAVSKGVAKDLAQVSGLPLNDITTIYNPVVSDKLLALAEEEPSHPWLSDDGPPVILAVGRLEQQKNYPDLLHAVAKVKKSQPVRLIIIGEGEQRETLTRLARDLDISDITDLFGWADNPYAFMSRADVFVLCSLWEGLPGVLVEAMACGCPVVATDCPSGPKEILQGGHYGSLVPCNDSHALAEAIENGLLTPCASTASRRRASEFSVARAADSYTMFLSECWRSRSER